MADPPPKSGPDLVPILLLAVVIAVLAGGYLIFPKLQRYMFNQDCVAAGRTNCG